MALSKRKVLLFKLEEGLEVNLIGRNFTVWGEIREPFKLLLGRECLCKFFCFVLLLCVSVCLCVCVLSCRMLPFLCQWLKYCWVKISASEAFW